LEQATAHAAGQLGAFLARASREVSVDNEAALMAHRTDCSSSNSASRWSTILQVLATGSSLWPEAQAYGLADWTHIPAKENRPFKVLLVVAHPDDESECAAVLYRVAHEFGGTVDQLVITNGEGGSQFAAPAQAYYRLPLAQCQTAGKHLAKIRRQEVRRAGWILGVRRHYFLDEKDTGFTRDPRVGLQEWNIVRIRRELLHLLRRENDLVLTLLPLADTHGHHQTVALLTLEIMAEFDPSQRPAVLGVRTATAREQLFARFSQSPEFPWVTTTAEPAWVFDRRTPIDAASGLDYSIVANWIIAEHKTQGMFQMEFGRKTHECYWLFDTVGSWGRSRCDLFWGKMLGKSRTLPRAGTAEFIRATEESAYAKLGNTAISK
jgi:LmbE family N-acetylglucosaminyl deacetylase